MPSKQKQSKKETEKPITLTEKTIAFFREIGIVLVAVLILNSFVLASFEVPTGSMEDTVMTGDFLFVNKFIFGGSTPYAIPLTSIRIPHFRIPGFRSIQHGDVIVFDWPGERDLKGKPPQTWYLKRCVGLPGDTIVIVNRVVYVNGQVFPNPPDLKFQRMTTLPADLPRGVLFPRGSNFNEDNYGPVIVPKKGMKIQLNAENFSSWDVFIFREGHQAELNGERVLIDGKETTEYVVERDYAFGMGDNRDDSLDSRFWGFIPMEDIIGTPMIVYWSWDPNLPIYQLVDKIKSINFGRIGKIIR
ncbi:MAG: signal peptidase I [Bacteroidota bacterium]